MNRYNYYPRLSLLLLLCLGGFAIADTSEPTEASLDECEKNQQGECVLKGPVEEVITLGRRTEGDYRFITENAQKLVETAGALGDPLGAVFSLPGVIYPDGRGQEPAVRGSSPDDNAFFVDYLPASYIFHDFGVSVFSEYILHDFNMYSSGFGPEFGAATGAIFDINLREPDNKDFGGVVDFSMLRSGLFLESGLSENSAFYLSARRSMLDLFISPEDASNEDEGIVVQSLPQDTDYQFKYVWNFAENHQFNISANGAQDTVEAELTTDADFVASNPDFAGDAKIESAYAGWNAQWHYRGDNDDEFRLAYGNLDDESNTYWGDDYTVEIRAKQQTLKSHYSRPLGQKLHFTVGGQYAQIDTAYYINQIQYVCTEFDESCDTSRRGRIEQDTSLDRLENTAYSDLTWSPIEVLALSAGIQHQHNDYNDQSYLHPRFSARLDATDSTRITAKYGRYNRFPDIGTAITVYGNPDIESPLATHYTLGFEQQFENEWSLNVETYYKTLENLPLAIAESESDAVLFYAADTEGRAYGLDVMLNKNITDKLYGWLALSYGKSERTNTRTDVSQDYRLDTPMIANLVVNWQATQNLNFGWRWSVRSGSAYTPIVGVQENPYFEDAVLPEYGESFSKRLPIYNQLDFCLKWDTQVFGLESALILDVINALNIQNVSGRSLDYDKVETVDDDVAIKDTVGLGLIPAVSYRVYF